MSPSHIEKFFAVPAAAGDETDPKAWELETASKAFFQSLRDAKEEVILAEVEKLIAVICERIGPWEDFLVESRRGRNVKDRPILSEDGFDLASSTLRDATLMDMPTWKAIVSALSGSEIYQGNEGQSLLIRATREERQAMDAVSVSDDPKAAIQAYVNQATSREDLVHRARVLRDELPFRDGWGKPSHSMVRFEKHPFLSIDANNRVLKALQSSPLVDRGTSKKIISALSGTEAFVPRGDNQRIRATGAETLAMDLVVTSKQPDVAIQAFVDGATSQQDLVHRARVFRDELSTRPGWGIPSVYLNQPPSFLLFSAWKEARPDAETSEGLAVLQLLRKLDVTPAAAPSPVVPNEETKTTPRRSGPR